MEIYTDENGNTRVRDAAPLEIVPFSCYRLSNVGAIASVAKGPITSPEHLQALLEQDLLTQDSARAMYLIREQRGEAAATGLLCGVSAKLVDELYCLCEDQLDLNDAETVQTVASLVREAETTGIHTQPIVVSYPKNMSADIILSAVESGTSLYSLHNDAGWALTVWRIGRQDTIDALKALFSTYKWPEAKLWSGTALQALAYKTAAERNSMNLRAQLIPAMLVPQGCAIPTLLANMIVHPAK